MLYIKYTLLNLYKNKKTYIAMLLLLTISFLMAISAISMGQQVIRARAAQIREYAAVSIVYTSPHRGTPYFRCNQRDTIMNTDFMHRFAQSPYVIGYYAFTQRRVWSDTLVPVPLSVDFPIIYTDYFVEEWGSYHRLYSYYITAENMPFFIRPFPPMWRTVMCLETLSWPGTPLSLQVYSDISQSTHFRIGDRAIVEGRFAENIYEANISEDLAHKNNLSLGDIIEIHMADTAIIGVEANLVNFTIVGIFSDDTSEITSELNLILPIFIPNLTRTRYQRDYELIGAGFDTISRNQILTVAPDTSYLHEIRRWQRQMFLDHGHDTTVFYVRDLHAIDAFLSDISRDLHPYMTTLDSGAALRFIRQNILNTADALFRVLSLTLLVGGFLNAVLLALILKSRIYDIGVLRARGMSRAGVAAFFTIEAGIISLLAYIAAGILYFNLYETIVQGVARIQAGFFDAPAPAQAADIWMSQTFQLRELELYTSALPLLLGFAAIVVFTGLVGLGAMLFISRHEPLKTMTRY